MSYRRATPGGNTRASSVLWGILVLGLGIPTAGWQKPTGRGPDQGVAVAVARFYRGDRTLVNGFVRVPHQMLEGVRLGPGGFAAYTAMLTVTDSAGAVLTREQWTREVNWRSAQVAGAATVEPLTLALAPGVYNVQIVVKDSATGRQETAQVQVTAYGARPAASDLLLAYSIRRRASPTDTEPASGEVRKGDFFIATTPDVALTPSRATLSYYEEVYRDVSVAVPWRLRVIGTDNRTIVSTQPVEAALASGGGSIAGSIDLAGLPPASYRLVLVAGAGADTVVRAAQFQMAGFDAEREVAAAQQATEPEPTDRFASAPEAELDSLYGPLIYLGTPSELDGYKGLTLDGKRRFLRAFWRKRDPTAGTTDNNGAFAAFYRRIAEANVRFREGGAGGVAGWRTDRGRVFIRYGEPNEIMKRPSSGPDRPWEAWKYTKDRQLKFVFLDLTRLGNYALIYTNDRLERNPPDWTKLLSAEAVNDIASF